MKKIKFNYRHIICIIITLGLIALGLFRFFDSIGRIIESCRDFGLSIAYYFCELFSVSHSIAPTVTNAAKIPFFNNHFGSFTPSVSLPDNWDGFTIKWSEYWRKFITTENISGYLSFLSKLLYNFSLILLICLPIVIVLSIIIHKLMKQQNTNYNKDTLPLRIFKRISKYTYWPVKVWLKSFSDFVRDNKAYWIIWLCLFAVYFNVITIILEFFAFYFYFAISFDYKNLYMQFYKLASDLVVPLTFIPWWVWLIVVLYLINRWRRKIGYAVLQHNELKNRGFINERPIVSMSCGTMGKRKTTMITDMALSMEVMLKDKAFEKLLEEDLKFHHFPWILLENTLRRAMDRHEVYNLATCRKFIKHIAACFYTAHISVTYSKAIRRHLKKSFGLTYENFIFGYDYERYGFTYNDKLKVITVWEAVETYAQLYFIYIIQSSLIISNYSVRTDTIINDTGNFPLWDTDFFKRDSRLIDSFSRHAHIIDFDALRLGKKVIENNELADSFEFGVVLMTEVGKERKNTLELKEIKATAKDANQKNDGFNDWLKMIRHSATVANYPFVKVITDEQRPESWGADARDLCEIIHIKECGDTKLAMPFFFIAELLYSFIFGRFVNTYYKYRHLRGDNTLIIHILKTLTAKIHHYYTGVYNTFGYSKLSVQIESGTQDGMLKEQKYYLANKKIYSKRFSTDCFSDFFIEKALRSPVGIDDLREYATEKATLDELKAQNSYFIRDLVKDFNNDKNV